MRLKRENQLREQAEKYLFLANASRGEEAEGHKKMALSLAQEIEVKTNTDLRMIAYIQKELCSACLSRGSFNEAIKYALDAIETAKKFDEKKDQFFLLYCYPYYFLGKSHEALKNYPRAIEAFEAAISSAKRIETSIAGASNIIAHSLYFLGKIYLLHLHTEKAIEALDESIAIYENMQDEENIYLSNFLYALFARAEIYGNKKDFTQAIRLYRRIITLAGGLDKKSCFAATAKAQLGLAYVHENEEAFPEAEIAYQAAINTGKSGISECKEDEDFFEFFCKATRDLALFYLDQNKNSEMLATLQTAVDCANSLASNTTPFLTILLSDVNTRLTLEAEKNNINTSLFSDLIELVHKFTHKSDLYWLTLATMEVNFAGFYLKCTQDAEEAINWTKRGLATIANISSSPEEIFKINGWAYLNLTNCYKLLERWEETVEAAFSCMLSMKNYERIFDVGDWTIISTIFDILVLAINKVLEEYLTNENSTEAKKVLDRFLQFYKENYNFLCKKNPISLDALDSSLLQRLAEKIPPEDLKNYSPTLFARRREQTKGGSEELPQATEDLGSSACTAPPTGSFSGN